MEGAVRRELAACNEHAGRVLPEELGVLQAMGWLPHSCGELFGAVALLASCGWAERGLLARAGRLCASPQASHRR